MDTNFKVGVLLSDKMFLSVCVQERKEVYMSVDCVA